MIEELCEFLLRHGWDEDIADGGLTTEYPDVFVEKNIIYTNNSSEIYR